MPGQMPLCGARVCHCPPTSSLASKTLTSKPASSACFAVTRPLGPAPTMATRAPGRNRTAATLDDRETFASDSRRVLRIRSPVQLTCVLSAALVAALVPVDAGASELIARNATGVRLQADAQGRALISFRSEGQSRQLLAWGAVNARPPSQAVPQVAFQLRYGGSIGSNVCGGYRRPAARLEGRRLHDTGRHPLGAPGLAADAAELRRRPDGRPGRLGAPALALVGATRAARDLDRLVVPAVPPPLRPAHVSRRRRVRLPLDPVRRAARHVRAQHLRRHVREQLRRRVAAREQLPQPQADGRLLLRVLPPRAASRSAPAGSTARP